MRILVVSDSHGSVANLAYLARTLGSRLDLVIHLGDGASDFEKLEPGLLGTVPLVLVRGNMDSNPRLPPSRVTAAGKHLIYASHGHAALASGSLLPLLYAAREAGASVCLFGHTHIPLRKQEDGLLILNPGSLSRPRGGWGPTFAILTVPENGTGPVEAEHYEILNPGKNPSLRIVRPGSRP